MKLALALLTVVALAACGTTGDKSEVVRSGDNTAVKDQTAELSTEFRREGVRVYYRWNGDVERVEAVGFAEVWQGNYEHVAELDAKDRLIKFLRGESVTTARKTQVIARALERAQDNTLNRFANSDQSLNFTAEELEAPSKEENNRTNTALRKTSINNAQVVTSTITVTAQGRLNAVRKLKGNIVNDGRVYVATYVWTPKEQDAARSITRMMDRK